MIDIDKLEALAKAAGGDEWTASDRIVWFGDGDSAMQAITHDNLGTWPDPIAAEDVAQFAAAVCPAAILALIAEVRALREALGAINVIRNSIIGLQTLNWSEHVYPLVAALDAAGIEGMDYPEARENFGTMLDRCNAAEDDAERYRWLRDDTIVTPDDQRCINVVMGRLPFRDDQKDEDLFGNELDEAIDAARGAK